MKQFSLKHWDISEDIDCLLFFAQRISEVLFDFTLDSYKYPALYSSSIVEEAVDILTKIESNEISEKSIEPIIDELRWKLNHDFIVKKILGDNLDDYIQFDQRNISDIKTKLELLYNRLLPKKYIIKAFEVIIEIVIENKRKKLLDKIIPNLVSALVDFGYSQNFLNFHTLKFFFYRNGDNGRISKPEQIKEYFEIFTLIPNEYCVLFKGSQLFSEINTSCGKFNIEILDTITPISNLYPEVFYINRKGENEVFLICKEIKALDPQAAKEIAEYKINGLSKFFSYFHHKKQPKWSKNALIYDSSMSSFIMKLSNETSPMLKCFDFYPVQAANKLNILLDNFGFESQSFFRFDRAVELHGISLITQHTENQLLQTWIAFETLLVGYCKDSKIDQVMFALIPALKLNYLQRIIANFLDDLLRWNKELTLQYLNEITITENILNKLAALVSIESNKPIREKFYSSLIEFPLLKFRLSNLHDLFSSPKNILEYYLFHGRKIDWQIKRIYRTRNLIVHTGFVPDFTDVLIENSHNYLDIFLNQIIDLVLNDGIISNITHGIKEIQIQQKKHEDFIKKELNNVINEDNYNRLIFGYSTFVNSVYNQLFVGGTQG